MEKISHTLLLLLFLVNSSLSESYAVEGPSNSKLPPNYEDLGSNSRAFGSRDRTIVRHYDLDCSVVLYAASKIAFEFGSQVIQLSCSNGDLDAAFTDARLLRPSSDFYLPAWTPTYEREKCYINEGVINSEKAGELARLSQDLISLLLGSGSRPQVKLKVKISINFDKNGLRNWRYFVKIKK